MKQQYIEEGRVLAALGEQPGVVNVLRHSFILLDLERVVGKVGDVGGIQRDDLFKLRFRTALVGGEQVIERCHT